MAQSAEPGDLLTHPDTGEPLDLDEVRFVSMVGNQLTVYLPDEMEWFKGPEGDRRAREIGGSAVKFVHGMYPEGESQSVSYEEAKLLLEHDHYGEMFALAHEKMDVAEEVEAPSSSGSPDLAEGEVMVNGEVMTEEEAREELGMVKGAAVSPEGEVDEEASVPTEPASEELTVLSGPTNKTDALEALASEGVNMDNAPSASATSDEIQQFAVERGYVIEKYDLP